MATIPASENEFPEVLFSEGAAPAAPGTGLVKAYAKSDGLLYSKDDAGAETALGAGAHIADTTDAHDASAVSFDPTGLSNVTGIEVQTAIEELDAAVAGGGIPATTIDAKGDLLVGTADNTVARLAIGATNGMRPEVASGEATGLRYTMPSGYELSYVEKTSDTSITATSEATADTVVTAGAISFDGSTRVRIEFYTDQVVTPASINVGLQIFLYDGSSSIGLICRTRTPASAVMRVPCFGVRYLTPSNASHTYSIRAAVESGTGTVGGSTGGSGNQMPAYIRISIA